MTTIGIDPGKSGGIAWISEGRPCVEKMPETLQDLWDLICDIKSAASGTPIETKGDKNVSKRRAQELFPQLKVTHATADALLIAEYGRRQKP
jgi:hypothetical protein